MPEGDNRGTPSAQDRPGIRSIHTEPQPYQSFFDRYKAPLRSVPIDRLNQTRRWALTAPLTRDYFDIFREANDENSTHGYLSLLTGRVMDEERTVRDFYAEVQDRQRAQVRPWITQANAGMLTCQIASAINGLRQLGLTGEELTEGKMLEELGGPAFVARNRTGMGTLELPRVLERLVPGIRLSRSASVTEILREAEAGAAVMIPFSSNHEALIPPGHHLFTRNGQLRVDVIDPMNSTLSSKAVDELIQSEITASENLDGRVSLSSSVLIMKRPKPAGIQTIRSINS